MAFVVKGGVARAQKRQGDMQTLTLSLLVPFLSVIERGGTTGSSLDALLLEELCETRLMKYKHEFPHWLGMQVSCRGLA